MDAIEQTIEIDAPRERVFEALTDADELVRWFPSGAESDPRTGGAFEYRFEFPAEPERDHTYSGAYHAVRDGERVSYPWKGGLGETRVDVTLEAAGEATVVRLVHSGWGEGAEWEQSRQTHEDGWGFFLGNLKTYVERGKDGRGTALGMQTAAA
jgi:uncharacterized protein YndB with AHSA1/START domain